MKRIKPYGKTYYKRLIQEVEANKEYYPCKTCGNPVREPYCCTYCGDTSPDDGEESDDIL